jgi:hypothetical protein
MQRKFVLLFTFSLLLGPVLSRPAVGQTYTPIDYPGAVNGNSFATDINDLGQIVGEYQYGPSFNKQRYGYLYSGGVFTPVIFPGADWTRAVAINRYGDIVGDYAKGVNNGNGQDFGYLLHAGVYTSIRFPNSDQTIAFGINSNGDIVGWYKDKTGTHGFLLSTGVYTSIDFPGSAADTEPGRSMTTGKLPGVTGAETTANTTCLSSATGALLRFLMCQALSRPRPSRTADSITPATS